jgi:hypothetical protein
MRYRFASSIVVLIMAFSLSALAQTPAKPQTAAPSASTAQAASHDLSGVWVQQYLTNSWSVSDPYGHELEDGTPYRPEALAKLKSEIPLKGPNGTDDRNKSTDPVVKYCDPPGIPRELLNPRPFKIFQTPYELVMIFEDSRMWREIFMDGRPLPKDPDLTWFGYSVGKWEGGTLVVNTVGFKDTTWLDQLGRPHSDALRLTERYRRVDHDTLQLDVTIDDAKMYTKPWTGQKTFRFRPVYDMRESICTVDKATAKPAKGMY